ncbi:bifunctional 2-C-methyl-D-erythritol 4-phosphate cytidylyltransferase/2-C-methyl-D-erythritol 2,4-cyclodiphosphate synthase [Aureimonas sp. AU12]|uniref:bifunctional 2-C-methyl-D-erythritol 4-phosphate cytidylyltransferase/2-C-methyl-D-erythritol 2,4-cyclodiphosphate synthase n=1 Tax=Aureimonas sp. AU12 TaxID=1638161 RepID=UPI0007810A33|nr:bifunctional 2-C-methyl-D-erythritol 4-phosphate cytidylyltransferase/2-C-methyl-D-erythritol 2,4-cyclodiphosphate synthase [Aureimonas sp. AU12]
MAERKIAAVLVAAGRGERAGRSSEGPKQYRRIGGRPVLSWTLATFLQRSDIDRIVVVIHPDDETLAQGAVGADTNRVELVHGAATRQASVLRGLRHLRNDAPDIVLIHDAVRPFASDAVIDAVIDGTRAGMGAIPAISLTDTIKRSSDCATIIETIDRSSLFAAQTPQGFRYDAILTAHENAADASDTTFTDDASIAEWAGLAVALVPGAAENVKLTLAIDIDVADRKLKGSPMIDVRTGNGYDVHQLVPGDHVTLCGVRIPHDQTLLGHSDADVGLHALTDAILATCGAGDIGTHFPPSDPQWRGAASEIFVRHAVGIVGDHGGRICNVDITLISEAPKVSPHREAMVRAIGDMTGLTPDRISVKATTNETIGFVGRREGIAAIATASVVYGG